MITLSFTTFLAKWPHSRQRSAISAESTAINFAHAWGAIHRGRSRALEQCECGALRSTRHQPARTVSDMVASSKKNKRRIHTALTHAKPGELANEIVRFVTRFTYVGEMYLIAKLREEERSKNIRDVDLWHGMCVGFCGLGPLPHPRGACGREEPRAVSTRPPCGLRADSRTAWPYAWP